jgi:hypothetical protein
MAANGSASRGRGRRGGWRVAIAALLLAGSLVGPAWSVSAADTGVIAGADEGVRLRAAPGFEGGVVGTLWDGMAVELRIDEDDTVVDPDGETRWWPISTELGDGWVSGAFLQIDGWDTGAVTTIAPAAPAEPVEAEPVAADEWDGPDLTWSSTARVADADGVNLRAEPGGGGEVLRALGPGETVSLRSGASTVWADGMRWWPVAFDALEGWVAGPYLEPADVAAPPDVAAADVANDDWVVSEAPATSGETADFAGLGWVTVATDDGSGVNLRADAAPDAERIGQAFEGDVVELLDGPMLDPIGNDWFLVADNGVTGWVFGDYLDEGGDPDNNAAPIRAGVATGSFMYPVSSFQFTQGFGCSQYWWFYAYDPWAGCHVHDGIDLAAPWYTDVFAADGGTVEQSGWCDCGLGWYAKIDHLNGYKTVYGHLADMPLVGVGERVAKGDHIAEMGSTGSSTGSHLHFSLEYRGSKVDPLGYLP